jgi:hypothetical protein
MLLRRLLASAALTALAFAPAAALAKEQRPLGRVIEELNDPDRQDQLAGALEGLAEALLDVRVAPFMKAIDRAAPGSAPRDIDPDATLADMAGPGARDMPRELGDKLPMMMGMMGTMAGEMEGMLPELEAMAKRMEGAMGEAARRERRRRD